MKNHLLKLTGLVWTALLTIGLTNQTMAQNPVPGWVWAKSTSDNNLNLVKDAATDNNGNTYIIGSYNSASITFGSTTLTKTGTAADIFLVKYNANGGIEWAKSSNSTSYDEPGGIAVDGNGNVFISGIYSSGEFAMGGTTLPAPANVKKGIFLFKFDGQGQTVWARHALGDPTYNLCYDAVTDNAGNVYITGSVGFGSTSFGTASVTGASNNNLYVAKYDASGLLAWVTATGNTSLNVGYGITTDEFNEVYVCGYYHGTALGSLPMQNPGNARSSFIAKVNSANGSLVWAKSGNGQTYDNYAHHIVSNRQGKVAITGFFDSNTVVFDNTTLTNSNTNYTADIYIAGYDYNGNLQWAKKAGGATNDEGQKIATDGNGNFVLTGIAQSQNIVFDNITVSKQNDYSNNVFLAKYNSSGNAQWALQLEKTDASNSRGVSADANGNIYLAGSSNSNVAFGGFTFQNGGVFVAKMGTAPVAAEELKANKAAVIVPNPNNGLFQICNIDEGSKISIYNALEKLALETSDHEINMSSFPAGMYVVKIEKEGEAITQKVIIR